jgi:O-antigen/teichoic acid export membrane protein
VVKFSAVTALNRVGKVVSTQTARIVVGAADGVAAAAFYQVPNLLTSKAVSMLAAAAQVVFPTASAMKASGDEEGVKALYTRTSRLFFVVNGSVAMSLCVLAYPLLQYWVSARYAQEGAVALVVFALTGAIDATTMSAAYIVLSAARPGVNLWFSLANSAILLATVYPLTVAWGVTGAAVAGLLGEALTVPIMFLFVQRTIIRVSSYRVWRECYFPTVLGAGLVGLAAYLLVTPRLTNLPETLLVLMLLTVAEMAVSGLLGGVKREDVATAVALVRRYRNRKG